MKSITFNIKDEHYEYLEALHQKLGLYPNRTEAIRTAITDFINKSTNEIMNNEKLLGLFNNMDNPDNTFEHILNMKSNKEKMELLLKLMNELNFVLEEIPKPTMLKKKKVRKLGNIFWDYSGPEPVRREPIPLI